MFKIIWEGWYFHNRIISLRGEVQAHKTSLTRVPSQESERYV